MTIFTNLDIPSTPNWYKIVPMQKNFIKEVREDRNLTQEQLAEKMDTTAATVQRHEKGKRKLSHSWIIRYAAALECHQSEILEGADALLLPKNKIQKKILEAMNRMTDKEQEMYGAGFLSGLSRPDQGIDKLKTEQKNIK